MRGNASTSVQNLSISNQVCEKYKINEILKNPYDKGIVR